MISRKTMILFLLWISVYSGFSASILPGMGKLNIHERLPYQTYPKKDLLSESKVMIKDNINEDFDKNPENSGVLYMLSRNQNFPYDYIEKRNLQKKAQPMNVWVCKENFIGRSCDQWASGFYGDSWYPCKRNPIDNVVWGVDGICDDGKSGSGKCICKKHDLDPDRFWETFEDPEKQKEEEELITQTLVALLFLALACIAMVYIHSRVHILEIFPESIWAIFIGIGVGFLIQTQFGKDRNLGKALEFEPHAFFLLLLPPIMFQAGFSMSTRTFLKNIVTINAYAIGATIIASFIFSLIFYFGMLNSDIPIPYMDSLHFGWFISAIDPVATISIFKSMNVNDKVYMIVFGESTLNDAVAIALSSSAESVRDTLNHGQEPNYYSIVFNSIVFFTVFFIGSIIVGIVMGIISSYLFAKLDLQRLTWLEVGLFLQCAYLPYIIAEAMQLSGILAILITGIIMRNYAYFSLSPYGMITIDHLVEAIGYMWENFVFAYLGVSIPSSISLLHWRMVGVGCAALLASRFLSVVIVSLFVNWFKKEPIPFSHQIVMTYGGLRGAVAYYLALNLHTPYKDILTTMTIVLIVFTVIGLGSTTNLVLKMLNACCKKDKIIVMPGEEEEDELPLIDDDAVLHSDGGRSVGLVSRLEDWDTNVAQIYLRRNNSVSRPVNENRSEVEFDENDNDFDDASSVISKRNEALFNFFNRDVRGGDLSPYRRFKAAFNGNKKEVARQHFDYKNETATPVNFWGSINHKKSEFIPNHMKMDTYEHDQKTMRAKMLGMSKKAIDSHISKQVDGFSSVLPEQSRTPDQSKSPEIHISFIQEDDNVEKRKANFRNDKANSERNVLEKSKTLKPEHSKRTRYGSRKKLSTLIEEDEGYDSEDQKQKSKSKKAKEGSELPEKKSTFAPVPAVNYKST